jgi:peptidoglycan/LPS O-acetylase OafA/YrhL
VQKAFTILYTSPFIVFFPFLVLFVHSYFSPLSVNARYRSLDALRFFAFLKVFMLHIPEGVNMPLFNYLKQGGGTGVAFFFVLSGFLISDILLKQKQGDAPFMPKSFFMRRVFRIWPLYYVGVLVGLAAAYLLPHNPGDGYLPQPFYSLFFIENYKMIAEGTYPIGPPLRVFWSLCIEEHFYVLWLVLALTVKNKNWPLWMLSLWLLGILTRVFSAFVLEKGLQGEELFSSLDYFAAGALLACLKNGLFPSLQVQKVKPILQYSVLILGVLYFVFQHGFYEQLGVWGISVSAVVYASVIGIIVLPQNAVFQLSEKSILEKWGKWSYGLYVWHTPIILLVLKFMPFTGMAKGEALWMLSVVVLSFVGSLGLAGLSYTYLELPFLRQRERWFPHNK